YDWRGAINAMAQIPTAHEAALTMSFRFGDKIAHYANEVLKLLGSKYLLRGNPEKQGGVRDIAGPSAILCRTNAGGIVAITNALEAGITPSIAEKTVKQLDAYIAATKRLMAGKPVEYPIEFFGYASWDDVKVAVNFPEGEDLSMWVGLVEKFGIDQLEKV